MGVTGDTILRTVEGEMRIEDLLGQEIDIYCMDDENKLTISTARNFRLEKEVDKIIRLGTTRKELLASLDQIIYTRTKGWISIENLEVKDRLIGLNRKMGNEQQVYVALTLEDYKQEHRFIAGHYRPIEGWHVHHINGEHLDNRKSNLAAITHAMHSRLTSLGHPDWTDRGADGKFIEKENKKKKESFQLNENPQAVRFLIRSVEPEKLNTKVYTLDVDKYQNFLGNGMILKCS